MTHLYIEQNNGITEEVLSSVISKLYELALSGDLDESSNLIGRLNVNATYLEYIDFLTNKFLNLYITSNKIYILFTDKNLELILLNAGIGDGIGISTADAANTELGTILKGNTNITSFNEFNYFTKVNKNPTNTAYFLGCTNLSNINLSNVEYLPDLIFSGSGLTGEISLPSLKGFVGSSGENFKDTGITKLLNLGTISSIPRMFCNNCLNLVEITLPSTCTFVDGWGAFLDCSNLVKVNNLSLVTNIGENAFYNTSLLNNNLSSDFINITIINIGGFERCKIAGNLYMPNLIQVGKSAFFGCPNIEKVLCLGKLLTIPESMFNMYPEQNTNKLREAYLPYECTKLDVYAFYKCNKLTTVKLYTSSVDDWVEGEELTVNSLSRITNFGSQCFLYCSSLQLTNEDIKNATNIGYHAFEGSFLSGDITLDHLISLGDSAFANTKITSFDAKNSSFTNVSEYLFESCSNLKKIIFPKTVTYVGQKWRDDCPAVEYLYGLDNVTSHSMYNYGAYNWNIKNPLIVNKYLSNDSGFVYSDIRGTVSVHSVFYPDTITTSAVDQDFYGTPQSTFWTYRSLNIGTFSAKLIYFRDITSFKVATFYQTVITNLVINNVTPPVLDNSDTTYSSTSWWPKWGNSIFGDSSVSGNGSCFIGTLWVPNSAIAAYQADPLYSSLTIKGIDDTDPVTGEYLLPRLATIDAWDSAAEICENNGNPTPVVLIEEYM